MTFGEQTKHLEKAIKTAYDLNNLIRTISETNESMQAEMILLKKENARIKRKLQTVQSENRALHIAHDILIKERATDREKVKLWQARLNEQPVLDVIPSAVTEQSTQEAAELPEYPLPSSPPKIRENSNEMGIEKDEIKEESLSQRVLPMSIGISEAWDEQSKNIQHEHTQHQSPDETHKSMGMELPFEYGNGPETTVPSNSMKRKVFSELSESVDRLTWIENLKNREWHPADFKINPNYVPAMNLTTERNKMKRKCLHGADCPDCHKFYSISGITGAVQAASRHRAALDKQQTPPGYWDMDFPESSQLSQEKVQNREKLLNDGYERLKEALIGGRYVFKDEGLNKQAKDLLQNT